MMMDDIKDGMT